MKSIKILTLFLIGVKIFAATPAPFVLKWDVSMATPGRLGLVTLTPGTVVTLERGKTNDVFAIFGVKVPKTIPESEEAHRAISLEFRYRFLKGTNALLQGSIHTDQHGVFTPAKHPTKPCEFYKPASQELYSTETLTVPMGADSLEIERIAIDTLNGKTKASEPVVFALVGNRKSLLIASGDSRGDTKSAPTPYILGGPMTAGNPISFVFDEYRAMNAWVRTGASQKMYGGGFIASYGEGDSRTITCINKKPNVLYYAAWADRPLFEISTRVRFDQGDWQEFPAKKLYPAWAGSQVKHLFPFPFDTVPGVFRATDPYYSKATATIFPQTASQLPPLHLEDITVPAHAKTLYVQARLHAFMIAQYGMPFGMKQYVGEDCTKLYVDGQRVELEDLWDSPDFTPQTAWSFPVN